MPLLLLFTPLHPARRIAIELARVYPRYVRDAAAAAAACSSLPPATASSSSLAICAATLALVGSRRLVAAERPRLDRRRLRIGRRAVVQPVAGHAASVAHVTGAGLAAAAAAAARVAAAAATATAAPAAAARSDCCCSARGSRRGAHQRTRRRARAPCATARSSRRRRQNRRARAAAPPAATGPAAPCRRAPCPHGRHAAATSKARSIQLGNRSERDAVALAFVVAIAAVLVSVVARIGRRRRVLVGG